MIVYEVGKCYSFKENDDSHKYKDIHFLNNPIRELIIDAMRENATNKKDNER